LRRYGVVPVWGEDTAAAVTACTSDFLKLKIQDVSMLIQPDRQCTCMVTLSRVRVISGLRAHARISSTLFITFAATVCFVDLHMSPVRIERVSMQTQQYVVSVLLTYISCFQQCNRYGKGLRVEATMRLFCVVALHVAVNNDISPTTTDNLGLNVKCSIFLFDFNQMWIFSTDFQKSL
jgi:hypothetical protein